MVTFDVAVQLFASVTGTVYAPAGSVNSCCLLFARKAPVIG